MDLSLTVRILGYLVAVLTLIFAAHEAWEYFGRNSEISQPMAVFKIGGPLLISVLSLVILLLTQRNEDLNELKNQEKETQLRGTISSLETQLAMEARTIRSLNVVANVHFSGDWDQSDLPFSDQLYLALPEHMVFVIGLGALPNTLEFYGTKMYRFIETAGGHRVFAVEAAIRPGSWPLGQSIESISDVNTAVIRMPVIAPAKLKAPRIRIHSALVQFTVNDKLVNKVTWQETGDQTREHIFQPPNPNNDNRLVYVPVSNPNGLKTWESLR